VSVHSVALVTLGCARNDVDSEELAARLESGGFRLVEDGGDATAVVVNTCGFVEAAKKDSIDTVLAAAGRRTGSRSPGTGRQLIVAVGCLAERYGKELAEALPEADAVLGFDAYPDIADRLRAIVEGDRPAAHVPRDRRRLLPISPANRRGSLQPVPGHAPVVVPPDLPEGLAPATGPRPVRRRLDNGPVAPLKLASGCDRRCSFCAIPSFRGAFLSRRPTEVLAEARWLVDQGVREVLLVSENSTSYGKDLGDLTLLETMLPEIADIDGLHRVRVSYLQPAEMRPGLVRTMTSTPGVANYFDLSFQHAAPAVLRRMRRFGDPDRFLGLLNEIRKHAPDAGVRSNVIVGFPGETEGDVDSLGSFLTQARLDAIGVFRYSDEDGTEAARFDGKLEEDEIRARVEHVATLAEELTAQRAEDRIGSAVEVLVDAIEPDGAGRVVAHGRTAAQGPEDGSTTVDGVPPDIRVGELISARVVRVLGVDLIATSDSGASSGAALSESGH
jgi:ribosomal protein S12 methylthiotransferase